MSVYDRASSTLLAASALLTTLIVQPGRLGSDTATRLQTGHSFWTNTPQAPSGDPNMGLVGRGGRIYSKFGIGLSLLMLPFDMVAGNAAKSALWNRIFVVYSVSALVCVLAILASFRVLLLFEFTAREAAAGSLTLLFATTHALHPTHAGEQLPIVADSGRSGPSVCVGDNLLKASAAVGMPRMWSEPFDATNHRA